MPHVLIEVSNSIAIGSRTALASVWLKQATRATVNADEKKRSLLLVQSLTLYALWSAIHVWSSTSKTRRSATASNKTSWKEPPPKLAPVSGLYRRMRIHGSRQMGHYIHRSRHRHRETIHKNTTTVVILSLELPASLVAPPLSGQLEHCLMRDA